MKFNTQKIPGSVKTPVKIGNVYAARGGSRGESPRMWVLVAVDEKSEGCALLGLNADGDIISAVKYYKYTLAKWPVIGECCDIAKLTLTLQLF